MIRKLVSLTYQEQWMGLCELASNEQDQDKLGALFEGLLFILEDRQEQQIPEEKRYLARVLDSLDSAFADFDTETAMLDLPHMRKRTPEAIKHYLEFRIRQSNMLLDAVEDYVDKKHPTTCGHSYA
jgi:hypothetical protein